MLDFASNEALKRERDKAQATKPELVPPAGESPEALYARVIAAQFDDIGLIRAQAIREISGGMESVPPIRDTEPPDAPPTLRDPQFDEPTLPETPASKSNPPGPPS